MSSLFGIGANGAASFYNGIATQSVRMDWDSSQYLSRTPGSASNRRTFTYSCWFKRSRLASQNQALLSAGTGASDFTMLYVGSSTDDIRWYTYDGSTDYGKAYTTNGTLRDTSAWYHIVFAWDTTQAAAANRVKVYLNGVQLSSPDTDYGDVPQDFQTHINNNQEHLIGRYTGNTAYIDGYLAEVNFIDGTQLDASSFGETKKDVWIAKEYTGSYGTNGFHLEFKQSGVGSGSASTIGADTSGNTHHFTSNAIVASDCNIPDSPENNFPTLSALSFPLAAKSFRKGNLKSNSTDHQMYTATMPTPTSGKWYWEVNNKNEHGGGSYYGQYLGVLTSTIFHTEQDISSYGGGNYIGSYIRGLAGVGWIGGKDNYYSNLSAADSGSNGANESGWGSEANSEGILAFALDVDAGSLKYYWNNSLIRTDSTLTSNIEYFPHANLTNSGGNIWSVAYFNFGQDSSFAGTKTAQGNTDGNGIGDFYYSPPSGHLALCSANLPEPTIGQNSATQAGDHFSTVLHTADGSGGSFTGVGFQPDLIWAKNRTNSYAHEWWDAIRGVNSTLQSNSNGAEITTSNRLVSFDADGFTYGTNSNLYVNATNSVAWNWLGANSTASNGNGATTSTVSANQTAGFSIVSWTGTGSATTLGHGLSAAPELVIVKNRTDAREWAIYNKINGATGQLYFTGGAFGSNAGSFNNTAPTSTVFTVNSDQTTNESGDSMIAYCWHSVEGYSKIGQYVGNSNNDGPYVHTGFKPAWIMLKNTGASANWRMHDIIRQPHNTGGGHLLQSNQTASEVTSEYDMDFLSNGFKIRSSDSYENGSGNTFLYLAFAKAPSKYSNAG